MKRVVKVYDYKKDDASLLKFAYSRMQKERVGSWSSCVLYPNVASEKQLVQMIEREYSQSVGFALFLPDGARSLFINSLFVPEQLRGQGFGTDLLRSLAFVGRERHKKYLRGYVSEDGDEQERDARLRFFLRSGFDVSEEIDRRSGLRKFCTVIGENDKLNQSERFKFCEKYQFDVKDDFACEISRFS